MFNLSLKTTFNHIAHLTHATFMIQNKQSDVGTRQLFVMKRVYSDHEADATKCVDLFSQSRSTRYCQVIAKKA